MGRLLQEPLAGKETTDHLKHHQLEALRQFSNVESHHRLCKQLAVVWQSCHDCGLNFRFRASPGLGGFALFTL